MKVYVVERPDRPDRLSVRTTAPKILKEGWTVRAALIRPKALRQIIGRN
jgi:hypothetical protein